MAAKKVGQIAKRETGKMVWRGIQNAVTDAFLPRVQSTRTLIQGEEGPGPYLRTLRDRFETRFLVYFPVHLILSGLGSTLKENHFFLQ